MAGKFRSMANRLRNSGGKERPWLKSYPEGVEWDVEIEAAPVFTILDKTVAEFPDHTALDFLDKKTSYAELAGQVARAAKGLQGLGVGKDVKVGLFLPNCPYFVVYYYAILKAGGTVVNYNPLYAEQELIHQIEDSETDIMVTLDLAALYPRVASLLESTRLEKIIVCSMADSLPFPKKQLFSLLKRKDIAKFPSDARHARHAEIAANDGAFAPPAIDPKEDVAVLLYTGGTTGVPKGAMLTHANLYGNVEQLNQWFGDAGRERGAEKWLAILPFFHSFGMTAIMNFGLSRAAELILLPRFEIVEVLKTISRKRPTAMAGVPTMYIAINNYKDIGKYDLSSLELCPSGGASMPLKVMQKFESLGGGDIREGYGLTETSPVVCSNPITGERKEGSIGIPYPATLVEIVDLDDPKKVLGVGKRGEITVTGPQVMKGYWKRPEATADAIVNGRLHTGDIGYMDDDGYVFIVDRKKELIIAGGYNVYPRHVEEAIYQHPDVEEVAVVGIPDEYRGQTVKAFVSLAAGKTLTRDALKAFLEDKLSPIEMPKELEVRDELPKSAVGKILKRPLLEEELAKRGAAS